MPFVAASAALSGKDIHKKICGATEIVTYANDNVHHIVFALADPEINGGYMSDQELLEIIESLQENLQHIDIETQLLPGC